MKLNKKEIYNDIVYKCRMIKNRTAYYFTIMRLDLRTGNIRMIFRDWN